MKKNTNKLKSKIRSKIITVGFLLITLTGIFGIKLVAQADLPYSPFPTETPAPTPTPNSDATKPIEYKFLAPLPNPDGTIESVFTVDNDSFTKYLNMIIKLTIGIAGVLAVIMIVMGGIQYMGSELISNKEQGKSQIMNALLGLLITLGAYALLYTINPELLNSSPNRSMDEVTIIVDIKDNTPETPKNGVYRNGQLFNTPLFGPKAVLPPFASVYNGECNFIGQGSCTSTRGLDVRALWVINQGCKCNLTITGGTEWWLHGGESGNTSHQSGNSTIDLRRTDALDKYMSGGKPLVKYQRYGPNNEYYFEGDHWHVGP
jgi:hypothetical protein